MLYSAMFSFNSGFILLSKIIQSECQSGWQGQPSSVGPFQSQSKHFKACSLLTILRWDSQSMQKISVSPIKSEGSHLHGKISKDSQVTAQFKMVLHLRITFTPIYFKKKPFQTVKTEAELYKIFFFLQAWYLGYFFSVNV